LGGSGGKKNKEEKQITSHPVGGYSTRPPPPPPLIVVHPAGWATTHSPPSVFSRLSPLPPSPFLLWFPLPSLAVFPQAPHAPATPGFLYPPRVLDSLEPLSRNRSIIVGRSGYCLFFGGEVVGFCVFLDWGRRGNGGGLLQKKILNPHKRWGPQGPQGGFPKFFPPGARVFFFF